MKYAIAVLTNVVSPAYSDIAIVDIIERDTPIESSYGHYIYIDITNIDYEFKRGAYRISEFFRQKNKGVYELSVVASRIEKLQYGKKISQMYIDEWLENMGE